MLAERNQYVLRQIAIYLPGIRQARFPRQSQTGQALRRAHTRSTASAHTKTRAIDCYRTSWLYGHRGIRRRTGARLPAGGTCAIRRPCQKQTNFRGLPMSSTFDTVANIISETCDIEREKITPESHAIDDLGIDSLGFLDVAFAIDKAFGIKLPLEQWTQEVNDGKATTEQYFVLKNLCSNIDKLVAAKAA